MKDNQTSIYLDQDQCDDFNIEYYEDDSCSLPANVIRRSKDYDKVHSEFLSPLGNRVLHLERVGWKGQDAVEGKPSKWDSPGWYRVTNTDLIG